MEGEGNPDILSLKEGEPSEKHPITKDTKGSADTRPIIERKRKASEDLQPEPKRKGYGYKGYKTTICYHWEKRKCNKGKSECPFAHGRDDLKGNKYIPKERTYDRERDRFKERERDRVKDLEYTLGKKNDTIHDQEEYIKKLKENHKEDKVEYKLKITRLEHDIKQIHKENQHLKQQLQEKNMILQHIVRIPQIPQYTTSYHSQPQPPPLIYKPS